MSYRMIYTLRRLMCDKFSVLCTLAELNAKQLREFDEQYDLSGEGWDDNKTEVDTMNLNVRIKRLNDDAVIPKYAREGDAGFDLIATEDVIIEPGVTKLVPTGLAFELPPGYEMQIRPRSGVTLKTKLRVQLGTIDSGYRGEVSVIVDNINGKHEWTTSQPLLIDGEMNGTWEFHGENEVMYGSYVIRKGDRIAQAVIAPVETAHFVDADKLEESMRGGQGFGSSGVSDDKNYAELWQGEQFAKIQKGSGVK
jgi:dUTP pyrophosphatase